MRYGAIIAIYLLRRHFQKYVEILRHIDEECAIGFAAFAPGIYGISLLLRRLRCHSGFMSRSYWPVFTREEATGTCLPVSAWPSAAAARQKCR